MTMQTIKLEGNIGENLDDLGFANAILDTTERHNLQKELIYWTSLKLKISAV